jgi:hypothetical protein
VRCIVIAHAGTRAGGVEVLAEHQAAGFLEPQPLLELQRARMWHTATPLPSSSVLIVGGDAYPGSAEVYAATRSSLEARLSYHATPPAS